jgi:hypothetical protein
VYKAKMPVWGINQDCYIRQAGRNSPRKAIKITPGTIPTTAVAAGRDNMPLLTISAIMRTATSGHDSVLYLMAALSSLPKTSFSGLQGYLMASKRRLSIRKKPTMIIASRRAIRNTSWVRCRKTMWFKIDISRTAEAVLFVVAHVAHVCHFSLKEMF